jgi:hypothetical protein
MYAGFGRFLYLHGHMTLRSYIAQKAGRGFPLQNNGFNGSRQCPKFHVSMDLLAALSWRDAHRVMQKPQRPSGQVSPRSRLGTQPVALRQGLAMPGLYCSIVIDISHHKSLCLMLH